MTTTRLCPDTVQLQRFLARDLSEQASTQLEEHIRECCACEHALAALGESGCSLLASGEEPPHTRVPAAVEAPSWCAAEQPVRPSGQSKPASDAEGGHRTPLDELRPGERLGKYIIIGILGRGGMGLVFKARDSVLERTVAIKVLGPLLAGNPLARKRFMREGRTAAAVKDHHIVTVYDVEGAEDSPYMVLEYVEGKSLQDILETTGALPVDEVVRLGVQIAAGLAAAHQKGLIHRDIKPANMLLEEGTGRVAITDFGLARAVDDSSLSRSGEICGTPQFMAPEQVSGGAIDHRADLFSFGSVLYYMCAGQLPFTASTSMAVCHRVLNEQPTPIEECNSSVPRWLAALIQTLHPKDPAERIQSAAEVREALLARDRWQQTRRVLPGPENPEVDVGRPKSRAPGILFALFLALIFLGSFAGFFFLSQQGGKPTSPDTGRSGEDSRHARPVVAADQPPKAPATRGGAPAVSPPKSAPAKPKSVGAPVPPRAIPTRPVGASAPGKPNSAPKVVEGVVVIVANDQRSQAFLKDEGLCAREETTSQVVSLRQGRNYIPLGDYRLEQEGAGCAFKVSPKRFTVSNERSVYLQMIHAPPADTMRPTIILPPPPEGFPPPPPPPPPHDRRRPPGP
jgi:serine/threonine protein kinase